MSQLVWVFFAILSAVFAALVTIFGKMGLESIHPIAATFIRSVLMAIIVGLVAFFVGREAFVGLALDSKALIFIVFSALAGTLSWIFYFVALKFGPARGVAALDRLSIVFIVILASAILGESFTMRTAIGMLLVIGGALLLL